MNLFPDLDDLLTLFVLIASGYIFCHYCNFECPNCFNQVCGYFEFEDKAFKNDTTDCC